MESTNQTQYIEQLKNNDAKQLEEKWELELQQLERERNEVKALKLQLEKERAFVSDQQLKR